MVESYNVAEILVLVGGIATAITGMIVAIITAWRTGAKVDQTSVKVDTAIAEVAKVHVLTNDRATKQDQTIAALQEEIKVLVATISAAHVREAEENKPDKPDTKTKKS